MYAFKLCFCTEQVRSLRGQRGFWQDSVHVNELETLNLIHSTSNFRHCESFISISSLVSFVIQQKNMQFPIEKDKMKNVFYFKIRHPKQHPYQFEPEEAVHLLDLISYSIISWSYILFPLPAGNHGSRYSAKVF